MERLNIALLFGTEPNYESDAFKFFMLYLNKIQKTYEFFFPDLDVHVFDIKKTENIDWNSSLEKLEGFVIQKNIECNHCISIVTNSFHNNYFFNASEKYSIITTDVWDKEFSPPSLFEYLLHCIYTCLIYSQVKSSELTDEQMLINIVSHKETRGCIADFTRQKNDDRIDIVLGYICDEHKKEIREYYGEDYLIEVQTIIERNWIGNLETKNSPAFNLKHIFKIDIFKDSGFNKTWWQKIQGKFHEMPGTLLTETLKFIILAVLAFYLIKIGIIEPK